MSNAMKHLVWIAIVALIGCGQVSSNTYKPLDHYYDRDDGFRLNSDYDIVHISNGTASGTEIEVSTGNISAPDIAVTDDLTVTDDTAITGLLTVGETLGVTGIVTLSDGLTAAYPALLLQPIRFCGNGPNAGTETFLSPVPFDDTEADFISGGAGCDGEDSTTIATADEPWPMLAQAAFKPVAAICTAICTGATAANDAIVFKLYDDTAAVTGATCTTAALGGDATAAQCTWTDTSPETIAAASAIAIGVDNTDDACADAGDDFECVVFVTF